jgi:hypothetical protein
MSAYVRSTRPRRPSVKATLGWGAAAFVGLQLALCLAMEHWDPDFPDPEFGQRAALLKAESRADPKRPVLVLVGSSRCIRALQPEQLPPLYTPSGIRPVVFNCSHSGSGPVLNLIMVHRLLRKGIHPDWLFVEIMPAYLCHDGADMFLYVMEAGDWPVLRHYFSSFDLYRKYYKLRFFSRLDYQSELVDHVLPTWLGSEPTSPSSMGSLGGPVNVVQTLPPAVVRRWTNTAHDQYVKILGQFHVTPWADHALRTLLEMCREQHIGISFLLMPEGSAFRSWYPPQTLVKLDGYLAELNREYGVSVIDARTWLGDEHFYDSHHVFRSGTNLFTQRFGREVIGPLLKYQTFPGKTQGSGEMVWGK